MWGFNPLFLRLHREISLSLLCSHSSWGSALDLTPPLHVGHPLASVLHPDRRGLKEWLTRGLWRTQAGAREGYGMQGECAAAVCSPGEVVPGSQDLAVAGCTGSWEGRCG